MSGLRLRVIISHLVLVLAALSALGIWFLGRVESDFQDSLVADLLADARIVSNSIAPELTTGVPDSALDALIKQTAAGSETRVTLIALDGRVLADSEAEPAVMDNHASRPEVQEALRTGTGSARRSSETLGRSFVYAASRYDVPGSGGEIIVRTARPSEAVDTLVGDMRRSLFVAVVVLAGLAILLSGLLSRSILLPLGRIGRVASQITGGNYAARVEPRPDGEVGDLADAFNRMAETVQIQMAAAAQERQRLAAALDSSVDAVLAIDRQSNVLYANLAAERLFQRRAAEIVGHPFAWTLPNDQIVEAIRTSERSQSQATLIERPGRQYLQVVTAPIRGGGEWAVLVVFNDVTEVRRTELMRRDFVANVGHELRTPLAAIKSVVETLADGAIDDKAVAQDFLARADDEVDRLVQMVEELLELSRVEAGDLPLNVEPTRIDALLADIVRRLEGQAERKGIELSLEVEPGLELVPVDGRRLEHAVMNLAHNAIKFTPEGGTVVVSAARDDDALVIKVADTGFGIAPQDLARIFERFYKADQSRASVGSGLGLAVVKHTVEAHGGTVRAESLVGSGSTFTITIPTGAAASPDSYLWAEDGTRVD